MNSSSTLPFNAIPSLDPYTGSWTIEAVTHLYHRTTYGATVAQISEAVSSNMEDVVNALFASSPLPEEPINFYYEDDPEVAIGASWVNKPVTNNDDRQKILASRRRSLAAWTMKVLLDPKLHVREKMTLFWNNHFVTQASVLNDPNIIYYNINLLRSNALGNFKDLTESVTVNPAMLRYLNGNQNSAKSPNENYARELLELFTLGKGDLAGSGDYTTFTEQDVFEAAKILTGWRDVGYFSRDSTAPGARFISDRHDRSEKQLSNRLGSAVISNEGDQEYKKLIQIIFEQESVSLNICRKLYRWFVYYDITEEIEASIIVPMAKMLRENNYEISPVLKTLLKSKHFFEICSIGPMIKNPIDFFINLLRQFEVYFPDDTIEAYLLYSTYLRGLEVFEMNYYEPPNVAGWKAYYQEPLFYRTWITAATLPVRQQLTTILAAGTARRGGVSLGIDVLSYITKLKDPSEPNSLIEEMVSLHLPQSLTIKVRRII